MARAFADTVTDYLFKKWNESEGETFDGIAQFLSEISEEYKDHPNVLMPLDIAKEGLEDFLKELEE